MRRSIIIVTLFIAFAFGSCQCSDKPEIGPVEDEAVQVTLNQEAEWQVEQVRNINRS